MAAEPVVRSRARHRRQQSNESDAGYEADSEEVRDDAVSDLYSSSKSEIDSAQESTEATTLEKAWTPGQG